MNMETMQEVLVYSVQVMAVLVVSAISFLLTKKSVNGACRMGKSGKKCKEADLMNVQIDLAFDPDSVDKCQMEDYGILLQIKSEQGAKTGGHEGVQKDDGRRMERSLAKKITTGYDHLGSRAVLDHGSERQMPMTFNVVIMDANEVCNLDGLLKQMPINLRPESGHTAVFRYTKCLSNTEFHKLKTDTEKNPEMKLSRHQDEAWIFL